MQKSKKPRKQTEDSALFAILKFVPLILFGVLVIGFQFDLVLAAPIAAFTAALIFILTKRSDFGTAFAQGLQSVRHVALIFFILMFAYGTAECFMATGVGAALINLALQLGVTARTAAPVALLVTCLLSIATGSSWATFAACAPIFLWLTRLVGGDVVLTACATAGGSCFGDNIGMISDVTVLSCGLQDVKIIDRVKHQAVWSIGCLVIGTVIFFLSGLSMPNVQGDVSEAIAQIPSGAYTALAEQKPSALILLSQVQYGVPYYMILPLVLVIVMSFMGLHTLLCLGAGMLSSLVLGLLGGTIDLSVWLYAGADVPSGFAAVKLALENTVMKGFSDAGGWVVIMMMWVALFSGIMNAMNAFAPLERLVVRLSRNVHHLMAWCGVLCLFGNAALADEAAQVTTMSPIVRGIVEKNVDCAEEEDRYRLRLKLATFTSSMGIYGSELIPWHCFPVFFATIATAVYPIREGGFSSLDIISRNYMSFIVVGSILLLTFTGLDRLIPNFGLPKSARLKKQTEQGART